VSKKAKTDPVKHQETKNRPALKISFINMIPLGIVLLVFIILWFKPYKFKLVDPWYEGMVLMDSASKATDIVQRNLLFDQAGKSLAEQVQKHPYHARVHYLYGAYWYNRQNWDSAIFQGKEAIRLGAGGLVNQIEFEAQKLLNAALVYKVMPLINSGNYNEAAGVLENAKTPNMVNPVIDKYRGIIYSRQGNPDSALACFLGYGASNPNDVDNLTNIGIIYAQKNRRDSAMIYINRALKLDPNNANAKLLNSQLNNQLQ